MMPVGWNSKNEARNTQQNHGPDEDMLMDETVRRSLAITNMILGPQT